MNCNQCGTRNADAANFCSSCGFRFADQTPERDPNVAGAPVYEPKANTSLMQLSPYSKEQTVFCLKGRSHAKFMLFPSEQKRSSLLDTDGSDILCTTKRLCVLKGDPKIKTPGDYSLYHGAGGALGTLVGGIFDVVRSKIFDSQHGKTLASEEIDAMCAAGTAMHSVGPVSIYVFKEKQSLLDKINSINPSFTVAFLGNFRLESVEFYGAVMHSFAKWDPKTSISLLEELETGRVIVRQDALDETENIASLLREIEAKRSGPANLNR